MAGVKESGACQRWGGDCLLGSISSSSSAASLSSSAPSVLSSSSGVGVRLGSAVRLVLTFPFPK